MKSFIVSLIFLVATILSVSLNTFFVLGTLNKTSDLLTALPTPTSDSDSEVLSEEISESVTLAVRSFTDKIPFLSLSIENELLRDLSVSLGNLERFALSGSYPDYSAALSDCLTRIEFLRLRESFSLWNVI